MSSTPPEPGPPAAPRRRLRPLRVLAALAGAGLLGTIVLIHSPWFRQRVVRVIETIAEDATGERVVIGDLRLDLPGRSVHLDGVVVRHRSPRADRDGRTIVAVEQVTVAAGLRDGRPRIRRLELTRPSVSLHLDEGRLREFPGLKGSSGGGGEELPWDELHVRDGAFSLAATYGADALAGLHVEGLDAVPAEQPGRMIVDAGVVELELGDFVQRASAVHLPGLSVTPQRIVAPEVVLAFPDVQISGQLDLEPAGPLSGLFSVSTELGALAPLFPGRLTAEGRVDGDVRLSGQTAAPVVDGLLLAEDLALHLAPPADDPDRGAKTYRLGDLHGQFGLRDRQLLVDPLAVDWAGGRVEIRGGADLASKGVWASITGDEVSLYDALADLDASPAPWVDMDGDLEIQAAGTLTPLRMAGTWEIAARDFVVAAGGPAHSTEHLLDIPVIRAFGEIHLDSDFIRLLARPLSTPRSRGTVDARIGLGPGGPLDLSFDLRRVDLRDLAPLGDTELAGVGSLRGWLGGPFSSLSVEGYTRIEDLRVFDLPFADVAEGRVESPDLRGITFPDVRAMRGTTPWRGSVDLAFGDDSGLDLQLLIGEGRLSDVMGIFMDLEGVEATMQGTLELRGPYDALDGEARVSLRGVELYGERFDVGSAAGWMDQGRFTLEEAVVSRADGREAIVARGSVGAGWAANIDVRAGDLRLEDMDRLAELGVDLRGAATLDAVVGGTLFEPEPRGRLAVRDTHVARERVGDSVLSFVTDDGVMRFGGQVGGPGLAVEGSLGLWEDQPYAIHAELEDFPLHTLYPEAPDGSPVRAVLSGETRVSGRFGDSPTPVGIEARIEETSLAWGRHSLQAPLPWTWSQEGEDFRLEGLSLQGGRTRLAFAGERSVAGTTRFAGGGTVDLDLLRALVPGLALAEGTGIVELDIQGTEGRRPTPRVRVSTEGATFRGDWFPARFEDVSVEIFGGADGYRFQRFDGRLGGGRVSGGGTVDAEGWMPRRYELQGTVENARVRYFDFLPAATGDARLTFTGPSDSPLLAGRVDIDDMVYSERIDWESWVLEVSDEVLTGAVQAEGDDLFSMDLVLSSEDTIRVRNNVADLTAGAELRVVGDTALPGLEGWVRAQPGGRIYLKEREFELLRGELRFLDPYAYDPELDFALATTVEGVDQDVDIAVQVDGAWSGWRTEMRSDPALAQADINALLLFGMTREEMERTGTLGRALAIEGGDVLFSSIGLVERAEQGIFRLRGLEPLLAPLRPDRLDLVSGTTERGSGTVSSELRLLYENDLEDWGWSGGRLIIEQNVARGADRYLGLEQRLARRVYLRGWASSEEIDRNLDIGGAYGLEVNLRWEVDL